MIIPQKLSNRSEISKPYFQLRGLATGGETPRESGFESQQGLITEITHDWGKQGVQFWRVHSRTCAHRTQGKKQWSNQRLGHTSYSYWMVSCGGRGVCGSLWEQKHWQQQIWGSIHWCEPFQKPPLAPSYTIYLSMLGCFRLTNRVGIQPQSSAEKQLKVFLRTALPTRGTRHTLYRMQQKHF